MSNPQTFLAATNKSGRFVVIPHNWKAIFPHLLKDMKIYDKKLVINPESPNPPMMWIERQAGGYGDIIHALSAMEDKIAEFHEEFPDGIVQVGVPARHAFLVQQLKAEIVHTDKESRNWTEEKFYDSRIHIQLLCPCDDHEIETKYAVTKSRVEIFYETCGVKGAVRQPKLKLKSRAPNPFPKDKKVIGICLRSIDRYKDWSMDRWFEVAKELQNQGYYVVTFDKSEKFEGIPALIGTTMEEVTQYLSWCDLVLAPDTGPLFIASALGVHTIGLFGKTSGYFLLMRNYKNAWAIQIQRPDKCIRPCYGSEDRNFYCEFAGFRGPSTACMDDITVDHVVGMVWFLKKKVDFGSTRFDRVPDFYSYEGKKNNGNGHVSK